MAEPIIEIEHDHTWRNWHSTSDVGGAVERFFTPRNDWRDSTLVDPNRGFEPGLRALQSIVRQAEAQQKRVRAIGSGWSLSPVAFVSDYLINTARLTNWSIGLTPASVTPAFAPIAQRIVLAQCGTSISALNTGLEQRGLALPTAGASNGQTIAGAISTGTHGSAHSVGGLHDRVLALHIVAEGGRDYLIQRATKPAVTRAYADWIGAELREDDDLFNAALVGFGSFGIIHAVIFEAAPLYLLGRFCKQFDYEQIVQAACAHDISKLELAAGQPAPYHIEFVINQYRRGAGQGGAFARVYYLHPYVAGAPLPVLPIIGGETRRSRDLVSAISVGSEAAPTLIPGLLQDQIESGVDPTDGKVIMGTPGQTFSDSNRTGGGTSLELGVPLNQLRAALDAIFSVTDEHIFGAPVAVRYVRGSDALLAFTCFSPISCAIEMPGIDSPRAREGHRRIEAALKARGVTHTYHWGQALPANPAVIRAGFGDARVDRWLAARRAFLNPSGRHMFSNPLVDACGLAT